MPHGHGSLLKMYGTFVLAKAVALSLIATLLNVDFWRALILVAVSAVITGAFALWVTYVQASEAKRTHDRLDRLEQRGQDIASAVGAARRETDTPPQQ